MTAAAALLAFVGMHYSLLAAAAPPVAEAAAQDRPNIVLVTLDSTRADHLGCYGWRFARTPNLDRLARGGTRFAACDTAAFQALPSHATILTGLFPPRHGVRDDVGFPLASDLPTVAELLAAHGYDARAVVSTPLLRRTTGLARGFRVYDDDIPSGLAASPASPERTAAATTERALHLLATARPPFFLWVHYFDPHAPYRPPPAFAGLEGPTPAYDGEIAAMDAAVGDLLDELPPDTAVVVVGDYGEMLGEHGEKTHGLLPYRGARRVPLILSGPGVAQGDVERCLVRTVDIAPTLLALGGITERPSLDGISLLPLPSHGGRCGRISYSEAFEPYFAYRWSPLRMVGDYRWTYVEGPGGGSLFAPRKDPFEVRDLAARKARKALHWRRRLRTMLGELGEPLEGPAPARTPAGPEVTAVLADLGVAVEEAPVTIAPSLPDPRRRVVEHLEVERAARFVAGGACSDALVAVEGMTGAGSTNAPALRLAGTCLMEGGRFAAAADALARAVALRPGDPALLAELGDCLQHSGRWGEAEALFRRALVLDPANPGAAASLARQLREQDRVAEAVTVLAVAKAAGAAAPRIDVEDGLALETLGDLAGALRSFREAAARSPDDAVPHTLAARLAARLGRFAEAAALLEEAVEIRPDDGPSWRELGRIYLEELGRPAAALRCFRHAHRLARDPAERAALEKLIEKLSQ